MLTNTLFQAWWDCWNGGRLASGCNCCSLPKSVGRVMCAVVSAEWEYRMVVLALKQADCALMWVEEAEQLCWSIYSSCLAPAEELQLHVLDFKKSLFSLLRTLGWSEGSFCCNVAQTIHAAALPPPPPPPTPCSWIQLLSVWPKRIAVLCQLSSN